MLQSLHIRNLALVAELDLELTGGFNVITGETGAGKSLVIGALQLLAGGRASGDIIRKGERHCEVSAIFGLKDGMAGLRDRLRQLLERAGIADSDDDDLLLRRVVTETGSRCFVNGSAVTVSFLRELGELLVDIHGPHDNQTILKNAKQLELLDIYAQTEPLLAECRQRYSAVRKIDGQLDELEREGLQPEQLELLKHQLKEITEASLQPNEDDDVLRKYKLSENSKRLLQVASQSAALLGQGEHSIVDQLGGVFRLLREIEEHDSERGSQFNETLSGLYDGLQELSSQLEDYAQSMDLDGEEIQAIEERLEIIQKLKRKYGPSLQDVFDTQSRIRSTIQRIEGRGDLLERLRSERSAAQAALLQTCRALDERRREAAPSLSAAITEKLKKLGFQKARFDIEIQQTEPSQTGANAVEFLFAPNLGEDPKPLKATASSGETARVMLALKTVLSDADEVPVLVFDEIDANVGGRTAAAVAVELRAVASRHQVFSITHLPPIAASGHSHYMVCKQTEQDRTTATMRRLTDDERVDELIRMLGAEATSEAAQRHAVELLKQFSSGCTAAEKG